MGEPELPREEETIEVLPLVVLSRTFPARPSSIPEIRDFVRYGLAESPLSDQHNREVSRTVFRALLDAAGPTGTIQVSFRISPEQVEVDVLHSQPTRPADSTPVQPTDGAAVGPAAGSKAATATFAEWMSDLLRREGLTHEIAARQLGVSVKTVSRWVGGETEPRLRDLRRIQERFGDLPFT